MTYGFLLLLVFVRTISYHNWFVYVELCYLQLFTIIAYHLNTHIMLLWYVICNYIWHMESQNYELMLEWILIDGGRVFFVVKVLPFCDSIKEILLFLLVVSFSFPLALLVRSWHQSNFLTLDFPLQPRLHVHDCYDFYGVFWVILYLFS